MTSTFDPLATSNLIIEGYQRYLKSLLPVRDARIASALESEISRSLLTKGPLLESSPPYEHGASLAGLIARGVLDPAFHRLASDKLPMNRPLYLHQEQAIRKVTAGRNVVVASGTGSGKTESFLLPILNALSAEHARGELGPGVRALLLYPMNALANDQIKRLRQILAHVPHITFGRYVGDTPWTAPEAAEKFAVLNPGEPQAAQRAPEPGRDAREAAAPAPDQLRHARVPAAAPGRHRPVRGAARGTLELHRRRRGSCLRRREGSGARHAAPSAARPGCRGTAPAVHRHERDRRR